ncbi:MAG: FtsQ-type POTRA domain-containing protein [Balneolales bacterium]
MKKNQKMSCRWLPHMAFSMLLVLIAMGMGWAFNKASVIKEVEVSGNFFTGTGEILSAMSVSEGLRADSLNLLEIMEKVEQLAYIKQAFINRTASGQIGVRVLEREPVALLIEPDRRMYVDGDGIRMPAGPGKSVDVPLLHATEAGMRADTLKGRPFETVNAFLQAARKNELAQITISEVAWAETEGIVVLSHDNGMKLTFGHEDFENRLDKWAGFYAGMIMAEGPGRMSSIDLRFDGQIVTR